MDKNTILIAEDEPRIRKVVKSYLIKENYKVIETGNGETALKIIKENSPDLLILDLMLPGLSGEEVCQKLRQQSELPVLMLTAKSKMKDKLKGLKIGADDYIVKPFNPKELVARIKAILRRVNKNEDKAEVITLGKERIKIFPKAMEIEVEGDPVDLTITEFKILYTLLKHPNQVLTRNQLADRALGLEFTGFDRTIDAHIKNIRNKLSLKKGEYIITVYGKGYKFAGDQFE